MDKFLDEFELLKDGELTLLGFAVVISLSITLSQIITQRIIKLNLLEK